MLIHTVIDVSVRSQAAVRALDTMADFAMKKNSTVKLTKFVVAGASKVIKQLMSLLINIVFCIILLGSNPTWCVDLSV